jgi:peroxiredoxin
MRKAILITMAMVLAIVIWKVSHRTSSSSRPSGPPAAVHSVAPNFSLHDLDGKPLGLANYRGNVVLLNFWATWCAPCRDEIPHFVEFQDKYRKQGFQVIGISMDDGPQPVREFYKEFKLNYPVALGTAQVAEAYGGVLGLPVTFLIGRDGGVAAKYVGEVPLQAVEKEIDSQLEAK